MLILGALNVVGLLVGAFMSYSAMSSIVNNFTQQQNLSLEDYLASHQVFANRPILYSLQPFVVNLENSADDSTVKVEVNLEVMDELGYEELVTKTAFVRDTVVKVLSEKESDELHTIQGKLFLKDDIALAVNNELDKGFVKGVYFTQFLINN